jgi:hypothetical protein
MNKFSVFSALRLLQRWFTRLPRVSALAVYHFSLCFSCYSAAFTRLFLGVSHERYQFSVFCSVLAALVLSEPLWCLLS